VCNEAFSTSKNTKRSPKWPCRQSVQDYSGTLQGRPGRQRKRLDKPPWAVGESAQAGLTLVRCQLPVAPNAARLRMVSQQLPNGTFAPLPSAGLRSALPSEYRLSSTARPKCILVSTSHRSFKAPAGPTAMQNLGVPTPTTVAATDAETRCLKEHQPWLKGLPGPPSVNSNRSAQLTGLRFEDRNFPLNVGLTTRGFDIFRDGLGPQPPLKESFLHTT